MRQEKKQRIGEARDRAEKPFHDRQGDDEPAGRVFGSREPAGRNAEVGAPGRDLIVEAALRAGRSGATPAKTTGAEALTLSAGDDVLHAKFGQGIVLELIGSGDKAEAVVRFPGVGEKRFLLAWTPLKRA